MAQPNNPLDLAPAQAAADATVAALQGAPAAPMPGAPPPPAAAPLPVSDFPGTAGATPEAASLGPTPGYADAASPAPAGQPTAAPVSSLGPTPGYADAAPSAPPTGAPPEPPGTVVKSQTIDQASTPGQAQAARGDLNVAQDAEKRATEQATREAARNAVIEAFQQRAVEVVARQRNEFETKVAVEKHERTQREMKAASEGELDPARVFTGGGGAWPIIQTLLAVASGGLVGGLGGSLLMLSGGINRAVRDDIERQRNAKDSRLAYLTKVFGDEELAIQRLKAEMYNMTALTNASLAADAKARKALSAAVPLQDALVAEHAREDVNFRKQHNTKVMTEVVGKQFLEMTQKPKAGPKPNYLNPETQEEFAVFQANGVDPNAPAYRKFTEERQAVAPTLGAVDDAERVLAKFTGGEDVPGVGPLDELLAKTRPLTSDEASAVRQVQQNVVDAFLRARSGAAVTEQERESLTRVIEGRGTYADVKRGLQIVRNQEQRKIDAFDSGFPHFARVVKQLEGLRKGRARAGAQQRQDAAFQASPLGAAAAAGAQPGDPFPDGLPGDSPERDESAVDEMLTNE